MQKGIFVKDMAAPNEAEGVFVITLAAQGSSRNGPYWRLVLADASGSVEAKIWSPLSASFPALHTGSFFYAHGRVSTFRDQLQFTVEEGRLLSPEEGAALDLADFMPASPYPLDAMMDELMGLIREEFRYKSWRKLVDGVFKNEELREAFGTAGGLSGVLACLDFRILAFPERPERKPADGRAICGRAAGFSMETRMRIGKWDHDAFVAVVKDFHGHVAPGVIIGGYMVEMARRTLPEGILYDAVSETVQCLPDAIQLLTPCTVGNGWLKVYHFGIYALSLYDKYTGEGTRVRLNVEALDAYPHVRAWFLKEKPKREQEPELLREEIRTAGMDLLQAAPVRIHPDFLVKKGKGVVRRCPRCGEWYPAVLGDLCRRCQGDGPYLAGKE